jgi:uncharacterized protein
MKKKILPFVILVVFFAALIFLLSSDKKTSKPSLEQNMENTNYVNDHIIDYVKIAGQEIKVELATTPAEKQQGLSGREKLAEGEGMLFVFDTTGKYGFWMKDMNFAIDMIWLGTQGEVVYIKKDARPESFPESFTPTAPAKYVLEVVAGFSEKHNLQIGERAEFIY